MTNGIGNDSIGSTIGENADGNASGKGIQQITLNLGDKTPHEIAAIIDVLPRISEIVLGDGMRWDGIVQELRKLEEQIRQLMGHMTDMQRRMLTMEEQMKERQGKDTFQTLLSLFLILLVVVGLAIQLWALSNG